MVQHGATWCNMVQHGATWCNIVQHGATWCNMVQDVPGLVHQAAGLQVLRGKVEEAGDEEVSLSDGKQLAHTVHLER